MYCFLQVRLPLQLKHNVKNMMLIRNELYFFQFLLSKYPFHMNEIPFLLPQFGFLVSAAVIFLLFHKLYLSKTAVIPLQKYSLSRLVDEMLLT